MYKSISVLLLLALSASNIMAIPARGGGGSGSGSGSGADTNAGSPPAGANDDTLGGLGGSNNIGLDSGNDDDLLGSGSKVGSGSDLVGNSNGLTGGINQSGGSPGQDAMMNSIWDKTKNTYSSVLDKIKDSDSGAYKSLTKALGGDDVPSTYDADWVKKFTNFGAKYLKDNGMGGAVPTGITDDDTDSGSAKGGKKGGSGKAGSGANESEDGGSASTFGVSIAGVAFVAIAGSFF
ncbi:hypothetical protein H4219_001869 [Mycoemilia scoparia]|uniref:Uncharacterized protein n=1 Tax=Mycoemilia scoparia TaxID=417184 RepID=A0A9W7ZZW6_9FUNG|nr:hypothetical protein H4219_001869 [Mycoemilia scoparia]